MILALFQRPPPLVPPHPAQVTPRIVSKPADVRHHDTLVLSSCALLSVHSFVWSPRVFSRSVLVSQVLTSELPAAWARDDLPTHTTNVAEGGTSEYPPTYLWVTGLTQGVPRVASLICVSQAAAQSLACIWTQGMTPPV